MLCVTGFRLQAHARAAAYRDRTHHDAVDARQERRFTGGVASGNQVIAAPAVAAVHQIRCGSEIGGFRRDQEFRPEPGRSGRCDDGLQHWLRTTQRKRVETRVIRGMVQGAGCHGEIASAVGDWIANFGKAVIGV